MDSLNPLNKLAYRRRARYIVFFGVMLLLVGLRGYIVPAGETDTAAHAALGPVVYGIWHALLTLGGFLLIIGVQFLRPEIESLGLWISLWAIGIHALALLAVLGLLASPTLALALFALWVLWGRRGDLMVFALKERRRLQTPYRGRERRA